MLTLITPAVVPKRHTLFEMIFRNNCAWLNMCRAVLNVSHFQGRWVWLFLKRWNTPGPYKCAPMFISYMHTQWSIFKKSCSKLVRWYLYKICRFVDYYLVSNINLFCAFFLLCQILIYILQGWALRSFPFGTLHSFPF